jgi:hypothetical protein
MRRRKASEYRIRFNQSRSRSNHFSRRYFYPAEAKHLTYALRMLAAFQSTAIPFRQIGRGFIGGLQKIQ